jgi:hypothetical protein
MIGQAGLECHLDLCSSGRALALGTIMGAYEPMPAAADAIVTDE